MSTEVDRPLRLVSPATGEVLDLDAPTGDLGRLLSDIRDAEFQLREMKRAASREILARMDKQAAWTLRTEGVTLTGQSPKPAEEWDGPELREALLAFVDRGLLSIEAVDNAVNTVVTYKPRKAGIQALRKLGGEVEEAIDSLAHYDERDRYVKVSLG